MKATITGFFDHDTNLTLEERIQIAERHHLDYLCLRFNETKDIFDITEKDARIMFDTLKSHKIKVGIIDPMIKPYRMESNNQHSEALEQFEHAIKIANKLKATHIYLRLFKFNNIIDEYPNVIKRLEDYVNLANKFNKKIIIIPTGDHPLNEYTYLFKKYKTNILKVLFDPVYIINLAQSTTTNYRLLKKHIAAFSCHDANRQGTPKLLGYGKADVINLFKKLMRDNYKGFLLVDNEFYKEIFEEEEQVKGIKRFFKSKNTKQKENMNTEISKIIFPNEETKNATYDDILDNQIKVLEMLFK